MPPFIGLSPRAVDELDRCLTMLGKQSQEMQVRDETDAWPQIPYPPAAASSVVLAKLSSILNALDTTAALKLLDSSGNPTGDELIADNSFFDQGSVDDLVLIASNPSGATNPYMIVRAVPKQQNLPISVDYDTTTGSFTRQMQNFYVQGPVSAAAAIENYITVQPVTSNLMLDATSTSLSCSSTMDAGSSYTFTGTVSHSDGTATPFGVVAILANGVYIKNGGLDGSGNYSITANNVPYGTLSGGAMTITAQYSGDQNYASSSGTQSVTMSKGATSVALSFSTNNVPYGTAITISATLTCPSGFLPNDGVLELYEGSTLLSRVITKQFGPSSLWGNDHVVDLFTHSTIDKKLNAGTHSLTVKWGNSGDTTQPTANYAACSATASLVLTKASLGITGPYVTKTYGQANPVLTGVIWTGFYNSTVPGNVETQASQPGQSGAISATCTADATTGIGTYTITTTAGDWVSTNYSIDTTTDGHLHINKATLTVTANSAAVAYNQPIPTLSCNLSGVQNSDSIDTSATCSATEGSLPGPYPITPSASGSAMANYTANYVNGTLEITP